jgi:Ran GTPase-activating protein (RanGAP) involved in mRNA processing and transport
VLATNTTLKKLNLYRNCLGPVGARSLAAALHINATLKSLDIRMNSIGHEGARSLAAALRNNATLTSLNLDGNDIGAQGARSLAATLANNVTLTSLDLWGNNIGHQGARSLAATLRALEGLNSNLGSPGRVTDHRPRTPSALITSEPAGVGAPMRATAGGLPRAREDPRRQVCHMLVTRIDQKIGDCLGLGERERTPGGAE